MEKAIKNKKVKNKRPCASKFKWLSCDLFFYLSGQHELFETISEQSNWKQIQNILARQFVFIVTLQQSWLYWTQT